jgi:hypothetical protein
VAIAPLIEKIFFICGIIFEQQCEPPWSSSSKHGFFQRPILGSKYYLLKKLLFVVGSS